MCWQSKLMGKRIITVQDSLSFLYRVMSSTWKKLLPVLLLYSKGTASILHAYRTVCCFKCMAFSSFKNRITVLFIWCGVQAARVCRGGSPCCRGGSPCWCVCWSHRSSGMGARRCAACMRCASSSDLGEPSQYFLKQSHKICMQNRKHTA